MKTLRDLTFLGVLFVSLSSCASNSQHANFPDKSMASLDEAKALIARGKVRTIIQSHEGPVLLVLRDGTSHPFNQPYWNWVVDYVHENGLEIKIDAMRVEQRPNYSLKRTAADRHGVRSHLIAAAAAQLKRQAPVSNLRKLSAALFPFRWWLFVASLLGLACSGLALLFVPSQLGFALAGHSSWRPGV